jgi:hypothetical protein
MASSTEAASSLSLSATTTKTRGGGGGEEAAAAAAAMPPASGSSSYTPQMQLISRATRTANRIGELSSSLSSSSSSLSSSLPDTTATTTTMPNTAFPVESRLKKEHENEQQQQQQQQACDISTVQDSPSPSSSSSSPLRRRRYLLSEMTRDDLDQLAKGNKNDNTTTSIHLVLQDLVQQLEEDAWSILTTREDVTLVVRPLLDACLRMSQQKPELAADLAERILVACLACLPPNVADRYPYVINNNNNLQDHTTPSLPSDSNISSNDNTTTITSSSASSSSSRTYKSFPFLHANVYVKVMLACGNLRTPAAAERVHRLFRLMMSEYQAEVQYLHNISIAALSATTTSSSSSFVPPRIVVESPTPRMENFKTLLRAYAISGSGLQGALQAHEILNLMENLSGCVISSSHSVSSSSSSLAPGAGAGAGAAMESGLGVLGSGGPRPATELIEGVLSLRLEKPPDLQSYTAVLAAYSKCGSIQHHQHSTQILQRARILWERMLYLQQEHRLKRKPNQTDYDYFELNWFCYYPMLQIYHNHVLALLQAQRNSTVPSPGQPPRRPPFTSSMDDSSSNNAAMVDYDILLQEIQNLVVAIVQSTTIPATVPRWYRVLSREFDDGENHSNQSSNSKRAQLDRHHPITWAYQVLIQALLLPQPQGDFAHAKKSDNELLEQERIRIHKAHAIVLALVGQPDDGLDSELLVYRTGDIEGDDFVWPCQDIILKVILSWERLALASNKAGTGGDDHLATAAAAGAAAAAIPERVKQLVKAAAKAPFKSLRDCHVALDFWRRKSQWKNAPFVNQAILQRLLREHHTANYADVGFLIPTSETFAIAMYSWMESQSPQAPEKIEWLFDQLNLLYELTHSNSHLPNATHVHLLLSSWLRHCPSGVRFDGKSGTQLLAAQHVTRLLESFDMSTIRSCGHAWKNQLLHVRHFGIALKAWAHQRIHKGDNGDNDCHPDQAHEAFAVWKRLVHSTKSVPPPIYSSYVLEACVNASTDAQTIFLSGNGGDTDEKEKIRRQGGHYRAAMHVYRHMGDYEIKNKAKKDKQGRDVFSYVLILQAWKQAHVAIPNQVVDDPIQFVLELMEDCCSEGLLTQTLCFEIVEFLLLCVNDDNLAKSTLRRLFYISESSAEAILQAAPVSLVRTANTSKLLWQGTEKPTEILVQNLPSVWIRNTDFGNVWLQLRNRR